MSLTHLKQLESESIYIIREVVAEFENPVMLYSVGKDSSVMVRLAQKAFYPGKIPFPLLHVDTSYKFPDMYSFRDQFVEAEGLDLIVYRNEDAIQKATNPFDKGPSACCAQLKTKALLDALAQGGYDAAFGGARRDEEKSRAKERIFSFRDRHGQWDPKNQRPELWNLYNCRVHMGESIRVFPLSNWTELDVWQYILMEEIPIVPMYFAREREVYEINGQLIPCEDMVFPDRAVGARKKVSCRFRSLGCIPCTGAVLSTAKTVAEIIEEIFTVTTSERNTRVIDHDREGSMEQKKKEGYF
ncbi:MAG: sulfate adenylyltransferase subunit CysD [Acidobacteria bacterium]|nr:MAG: sulfate adenylyltransferase subunit CysD [Acidobacteriota bacterium]